MPPKETSNEDILHALLEFHEAVGERFDKVDRQFDDVRSQLARIENVVFLLGAW